MPALELVKTTMNFGLYRETSASQNKKH